MPSIRYYTVTQELEIKVTANSPSDAIRVATAAFRNEDHDFREIGGTVQSPVREIEITAREEL